MAISATHKETGEVYQVTRIDGFYGKNRCGYAVTPDDYGVMDKEDFHREFYVEDKG